MSKFCSDIQCDFWNDFPNGLQAKNARKCPYCLETLLPHKPVTYTSQATDVESTQFFEVPDLLSEPDNNQFSDIDFTENNFNTHTSQHEHTSDKSRVETTDDPLPILGNEIDRNVSTPVKIHNECEPDNSDESSDSEYYPTVSSPCNSGREDLYLCPDIPVNNAGSKEHVSDNKDTKCPIPGLKLIDIQDFEIRTEMDPNETEYVPIQFNTIIPRTYWKKLYAVCLRIGHSYFGDFKVFIVPFFPVGKMRLQSGSFVTLSGTLKFPLSHISDGVISFPYKYFLYFNNGKKNHEHLHHFHMDYNRYFFWNISDDGNKLTDNSTIQHFDVMVLPVLLSKGSQFKEFLTTAVSIIRSKERQPTEIPFLHIHERRLITLQALLPSFLGCGNSKACGGLEEFLTQFKIQIDKLVNVYVQNPDTLELRYWDYSNFAAQKNIIKLVEAWLCTNYTPEKNSNLSPKSAAYKFYLACYLIKFYEISMQDVNLKVINLIEDSIVPILKNQGYEFDDLISVAFRDEIIESVYVFIFDLVLKERYAENVLLLIPIYHGISGIQERSIELQEDFKYTINEYWGFPSDVPLYCRYRISSESKVLQKALSLAKYDRILPYSIAVYSDSGGIEQFVTNSKYLPLSVLISVLLHQMYTSSKKTDNSNFKTRTDVINSITAVFTTPSFSKSSLTFTPNLDLYDMTRFNILTLTLALKIVENYFIVDQFKLCLNLLSLSLNYCDSHSQYLYQPPIREFTRVFKEFLIEWYGMKKDLRKNGNYNECYMKEVKRWQTFVTNYPFSKSIEWIAIIEDVLSNTDILANLKSQSSL